MAQPLSDVRVVELATGVSGPYCGKLFADFGADVVKVEPRAGDPSRAWGPFGGGAPSPETSSLFLHLNTNKRSVTLDPRVPSGRELLHRLCARADVVIDDGSVAFEELKALQPKVVLTSVTPFGLDGPYAGCAGDEIVYYAMGGPMHMTGVAEREPVKHAGYVISYQCGNLAATATIAALMTAELNGEAVHVDLSNFESQAGSIDRRRAFLLGHAYSGHVAERNPASRDTPVPNGVFPVADGYVQIMTIPAWVARMLAALGDGGLAEHWREPSAWFAPDTQERTDGVLYPWLLERTKQQAMHDAEAHRWAVMPVNSPREVVADEHFRARAFFVEADHPAAGRVVLPGAPVRMDDGWALRRPAPLLGEHNQDVWCGELGVEPGDLARLRAARVI